PISEPRKIGFGTWQPPSDPVWRLAIDQEAPEKEPGWQPFPGMIVNGWSNLGINAAVMLLLAGATAFVVERKCRRQPIQFSLTTVFACTGLAATLFYWNREGEQDWVFIAFAPIYLAVGCAWYVGILGPWNACRFVGRRLVRSRPEPIEPDAAAEV
ncbi:MAG: hypothetical protein N2C14_30930, partial [Planctomycetales bacterium]